jgi:predicted nucleotidyltransferase
VGQDIIPADVAVSPPAEGLLAAFSRLMRDRYAARLYLFGSRVRGDIHLGSDYDIVAVSEGFATQPPLERAPDRRDLWRRAGGWGIALDLHCYSPREFRAELRAAGYLGQAKARGELRPIRAGITRTAA